VPDKKIRDTSGRRQARSIRNIIAGPCATNTREAPGTIIIDPANYYVYRVEDDGNATRYGANVPRKGFLWTGEAYVGRKAEWATWTPPKEMIQRQPEGAQICRRQCREVSTIRSAPAHSIFIQKGVYTVCTIYSTSDPASIGTGVTSGCTGLLTQDMLDLYSRTPIKTKVISCRHRRRHLSPGPSRAERAGKNLAVRQSHRDC